MIAVPAGEGDAAQRLAAARATLPPGRDNSIAELFLERYASLADTNDPQAAQSISVVTERVLPAYLRLVQR